VRGGQQHNHHPKIRRHGWSPSRLVFGYARRLAVGLACAKPANVLIANGRAHTDVLTFVISAKGPTWAVVRCTRLLPTAQMTSLKLPVTVH